MIRRLFEKIKSKIRHWLTPYRLWRDYHVYQRRLPELRRKIFSKEKINVVFFPINVGMWKNDYLIKLMLNHPRFNPLIVSFFVPFDSLDFQLRNQKKMEEFFVSKGYPYVNMLDPQKKEWISLSSIKPDIVFYTQAVDVSYPQYKIKALWKNSLFYYIPYCLIMSDEKAGFNTLLFNIADKVFAPSIEIKEYWASFFLNKAKNVAVTGYPSFDYLAKPQMEPKFCWKCHDKKKRIIWAPHHSINKDDVFNYSNFLEIADEMIKLAEKYQDQIQIAFKPHPRLRPKLEQRTDWGVERTAIYYRKWSSMHNTMLADGDYFDLFLTSDAMIHDCITFMAEYLITAKPVLFVKNPKASFDVNDYGRKCYRHHYVGHTISDIEGFINNVVLDGEDYMMTERNRFVKSELLPQGKGTVAENIFNEIISELL